MKQYDCRKVENCFSGANIYEYRLRIKADEGFLENFTSVASLKYYKNFPRPCFQATLSDGTTLKGVIADSVIRVSFPDNQPQSSKDDFETLLENLLKQQADGRER